MSFNFSKYWEALQVASVIVHVRERLDEEKKSADGVTRTELTDIVNEGVSMLGDLVPLEVRNRIKEVSGLLAMADNKLYLKLIAAVNDGTPEDEIMDIVDDIREN